MRKLRVTLSIGFAGATHEDILEISDEELAVCKTQEDRDNLFNEYWTDWSNSYIDGYVELIEE